MDGPQPTEQRLTATRARAPEHHLRPIAQRPELQLGRLDAFARHDMSGVGQHRHQLDRELGLLGRWKGSRPHLSPELGERRLGSHGLIAVLANGYEHAPPFREPLASARLENRRVDRREQPCPQLLLLARAQHCLLAQGVLEQLLR
jgi:hypothetical protein